MSHARGAKVPGVVVVVVVVAGVVVGADTSVVGSVGVGIGVVGGGLSHGLRWGSIYFGSGFCLAAGMSISTLFSSYPSHSHIIIFVLFSTLAAAHGFFFDVFPN